MPVPCFLLFLCFRSDTQEIFTELDETSSRSLIFPGRVPKTERELEGGQRPPTQQGGAARGLAVPPWCVGPSWRPSYSSSDLWKLPGKIRLQELVLSNSENISCVSLLKHKNSKKQETGTVALVNRLVPENA